MQLILEMNKNNLRRGGDKKEIIKKLNTDCLKTALDEYRKKTSQRNPKNIQGETSYFNLAESNFNLGDFLMASYYYSTFPEKFPEVALISPLTATLLSIAFPDADIIHPDVPRVLFCQFSESTDN